MKKVLIIASLLVVSLALADDLRTCVKKLEIAFADNGWTCVVEAIDITNNGVEDFIITYKSTTKPRMIGELLGATTGGIYAVSKVAAFKLDMVYVIHGEDQWQAKASDCIKCYSLDSAAKKGVCIVNIWKKVH